MHGDEYEVVGVVQKYLAENKHKLPDYFYIPHLSPSALETKTRNNKFGHDLNRSFVDNPIDPEAIKIISDLKDQKFELALDFHEDPELLEFYMYDSGDIQDQDLNTFRKLLEQSEVVLFSGIDDPSDPTLGYEFTDGYASFLNSNSVHMGGTIWDYTLRHGITKRMITIEIPGKETIEKKAKIVEIIFEGLLKMILNF